MLCLPLYTKRRLQKPAMDGKGAGARVPLPGYRSGG